MKTSRTWQLGTQIINQNKKEDWRNEWANSVTGRSIFNHMTTPNPKDPINSLKREEQVTIFRLRSQHAPLNSHLKRIGVVTDSRCPLCPCPDETVAHHLFDCPTLNALRKEFLPPNPNITNTLYTNPEQLRNTHRYFVMANSRRTQAQWLLDRLNKYTTCHHSWFPEYLGFSEAPRDYMENQNAFRFS